MRGMTNRWQKKVAAGGVQQQEGLWEGVRCIMISVHRGRESFMHIYKTSRAFFARISGAKRR